MPTSLCVSTMRQEQQQRQKASAVIVQLLCFPIFLYFISRELIGQHGSQSVRRAVAQVAARNLCGIRRPTSCFLSAKESMAASQFLDFNTKLDMFRKHVINMTRLRNYQHVAPQSERERNTYKQMLSVLH